MTTTQMALPSFTLTDATGSARAFPTGAPTLLCFVSSECPTCKLAAPVLNRVHEGLGKDAQVWLIVQDPDGPGRWRAEHQLVLPLLDDSALGVSYQYRLEAVPTAVLVDASGSERKRCVGFVRAEWRAMLDALAEMAAGTPPSIDWNALPEHRPACGSRSVQPGVAERLAATAEGSPLRARRIDVPPAEDVAEFMFEQGLTDGLPVIAPTPERVLRVLGGTRRDAQEVVATVPPNLAPASVEKIAINAVMAGCRPEYLPVILTAMEAVCSHEFNAHGVMATTMGASPVLVVNGPIRHRIGLNMQLGVLGQGNRANATIGRAIRLVLRNVGGARPGGTERATFGNPMKYTMSFAEWEERSPWEPLHVERGFAVEDSVVTVFALTGGPGLIVDQTARTARQLGGSIGSSLQRIQHPRSHALGDVVLVVSPEHADTLARDGWTKADLRTRIQDITARPLRDLLNDDETGSAGLLPFKFGSAGPSEAELSRMVPKFRGPEYIHVVVAGSEAGKFTAVFEGWVSGIGSTPVSRKIEEAS